MLTGCFDAAGLVVILAVVAVLVPLAFSVALRDGDATPPVGPTPRRVASVKGICEGDGGALTLRGGCVLVGSAAVLRRGLRNGSDGCATTAGDAAGASTTLSSSCVARILCHGLQSCLASSEQQREGDVEETRFICLTHLLEMVFVTRNL